MPAASDGGVPGRLPGCLKEGNMPLPKIRVRHAAPALALLAALSTPARSDVISDWNAKAEAIAVEKRLLSPPNAREMAVLHVAMFEAVNAIDRRYAPYRLKLLADKTASKEAAAAAAAHTRSEERRGGRGGRERR